MTVLQIVLSDFCIHFIPVPGPAQSFKIGPGTSLCSGFGLSLPGMPHFLFQLTIPKQEQESLCDPCPYCVCQAQPLPDQLAQSRHRTVTSDPGLVNPESFMEASAWAMLRKQAVFRWRPM